MIITLAWEELRVYCVAVHAVFMLILDIPFSQDAFIRRGLYLSLPEKFTVCNTFMLVYH